MKTLSKIVRWIAYILSGLIVIFFLIFIIGEGVSSLFSQEKGPSLTSGEIAGFIFLGLSLLGLLIGYKNSLIGGFVAFIGALAFLIQQGEIFSTDAWPFFLLLLAGILHLLLWYMTRVQVAVIKSS